MVKRIKSRTNQKRNMVLLFYFIIILILFLGLFTLYTMNNFYQSNSLKTKVNSFVHGLDENIANVWLMINTEKLNEFNEFKTNINIRNDVVHVLYDEISPSLHTFGLNGDLKYLITEFENVTDNLIINQKENIVSMEKFSSVSKEEKILRYTFTDLALEVDDLEFVSLVWEMRYLSKEALYQYKDSEHLDMWLGKIDEIDLFIRNSNLPDKEILLKKLEDYKIISNDLGTIVIRQNEILSDLELKAGSLTEIMEHLETKGQFIMVEIEKNDSDLVTDSFIIIIIIIFIGIVSLFISRKYFIDF